MPRRKQGQSTGLGAVTRNKVQEPNLKTELQKNSETILKKNKLSAQENSTEKDRSAKKSSLANSCQNSDSENTINRTENCSMVTALAIDSHNNEEKIVSTEESLFVESENTCQDATNNIVQLCPLCGEIGCSENHKCKIKQCSRIVDSENSGSSRTVKVTSHVKSGETYFHDIKTDESINLPGNDFTCLPTVLVLEKCNMSNQEDSLILNRDVATVSNSIANSSFQPLQCNLNSSREDTTSVTDSIAKSKESAICSSQMSGLSPAFVTTLCRGKQTEILQHNYRISTSVVSSKLDNLSERNISDLTGELKSIALKENSYQLPSSVYGTQASNIETVLSGLSVTANDTQFLPNFHLKDQHDKLHDLSSSSCSSFNSSTSCIESPYKTVQTKERKGYKSDILDCQKEFNPAQFSSGLTLNISAALRHNSSSDSSSNSSPESIVLTTDISKNSKSFKSSKVTSPQILEQHISKIISENAAIVDTLDPLWTKRYMRQSSVICGQGGEADSKKTNSSLKVRRFSEDVNLASSSKFYSSGYQSKLQSALLGKTDAESCSSQNPGNILNCDGLPVNTTVHQVQDTFISNNNKHSLVSKTQSGISSLSSLHAETSDGSGIKSRLNIKVQSPPTEEAGSQKHPQNPEGSIIKDLLLKSRSPSLLNLSSGSVEELKVHSPTQDSPFKKKSEDLLSVVYVCTNCKIGFRNKENLEIHQLHYCKSNRGHTQGYKNIVNDPTSVKNLGLTIHSSSLESQSIACSSLADNTLSKLDLFGFIESNKETTGDTEEMGQILKKQLLAPLSRGQSPPLKKRKISEPVISMNKYEVIESPSRIEDLTSPTKQKFGMSLLPHRCRSQSVHMFGGEVQILDGIETKKMKIDTGLQNNFPSMLSSISHHSSIKNMPIETSSITESHHSSLPAVVVTIAKPVLNSGGTVMQVNTTSANRGPIMSLSSHFISGFSDLNNPSSMFSSSSPPELSSPFPVISLNTLNVSNDKLNPLVKSTSQNTGLLSPTTSAPFLSDLSCGTLLNNDNMAIKNSFNPLVTSGEHETSGLSIKKFGEFQILPGNAEGKLNAQNSEFPKHESSISLTKQIPSSISSSQDISIPTLTLTPSSPLSPNKDAQKEVENKAEEKDKKFLAPVRPTSLPLKKKAFTLVGSTLISPETPRPKKSCVQLYLNGHAYTYLGLKCSTRSTFCCIYRPQPMFVPQETDPKLSMYSNWQVVPAKEQLFGLTPVQLIPFYDSRQRFHSSKPSTMVAKPAEPLVSTHSSYWVFRSQEKDTETIQEVANESHSSIDVEDDDDMPQDTETRLFSSPISSTPSHSDLANDPNDPLKEQPGLTLSTSIHETSSSDSDGGPLFSEDKSNYTEDSPEDAAESGDSCLPHPPKRVRIFEGGFKSNEDYTYVRGRGRGKYVCEECGIRCKKPSMLKKHIRTHTDLRPYKCRHCSFAFKTKGNLTKHMKSKAHHKKCMELGIVPVPTTIDESQIDEDALAKQEQLERRHQQFSDGEDLDDDDDDEDDDFDDSEGIEDEEAESDGGLLPLNQNRQMEGNSVSSSQCPGSSDEDTGQFEDSPFDKVPSAIQNQQIVEQEKEAAHSLLHLATLSETKQWTTIKQTDSFAAERTEKVAEPLAMDLQETDNDTYPTSPAIPTTSAWPTFRSRSSTDPSLSDNSFHSDRSIVGTLPVLWIPPEPLGHRPRSFSVDIPLGGSRERQLHSSVHAENLSVDTSDEIRKDIFDASHREPFGRRYSISVAREARHNMRILQGPEWGSSHVSSDSQYAQNRWSDLNSEEPMDLSITRSRLDTTGGDILPILRLISPPEEKVYESPKTNANIYQQFEGKFPDQNYECRDNSNVDFSLPEDGYNGRMIQPQAQFTYLSEIQDDVPSDAQSKKDSEYANESSPDPPEYRLCSPAASPVPEENSSHIFATDPLPPHLMASGEISPDEPTSISNCHAEFIMPSISAGIEEGRCICGICNKTFAKPSQLRLHVNIHYFERPFRCDNCAVSFRTKGHLQKHKRSVSHYNKVNMNMTFGTPTTDNPRPFKCADCKIAFRIHGHLAKHLRSKMHIMKLECLGKLPFGMYAEMERSGVSLNEIDTTDCNNSLESLQLMAQRLYRQDPRRMRWQSTNSSTDIEASKSMPSLVSDVVTPEHSVLLASGNLTQSSTPTMDIGIDQDASVGVKQEPSEVIDTYCSTSGFSDGEGPLSPPVPFNIPPSKESNCEGSKKIADSDLSLSLHRSCTCHLCGRLFKSAKFLQVHLYCDHPGWSPPTDNSPGNTSVQLPDIQKQDFICELCRRQFSNQNTLQQHLLSHAQPRPYVCEICDAGFTSSLLLDAHLLTHQHMEDRTKKSRRAHRFDADTLDQGEILYVP